MRSRGCCRRFCPCFPSVLSLVYLKKKTVHRNRGACRRAGEVGERESEERKKEREEKNLDRGQTIFFLLSFFLVFIVSSRARASAFTRCVPFFFSELPVLPGSKLALRA